jgi:hypothetical protein
LLKPVSRLADDSSDTRSGQPNSDGSEVNRRFTAVDTAAKVASRVFPAMTAIAIGYCGDPATSVERDQTREKPSERKYVSKFAFHGTLPAEP